MLRFRDLAESLKRLGGPAGPWLNRAMALLLAVWITHAILRAAVLFRNDAFGFPLVGKADWYIFHALFLDLHWIFLWSLPFVILLVGTAHKIPKLSTPVFVLLATLHAVSMLFTVIDHETMRFMGMHLDPGMLGTYGNAAAVREVFEFLLWDESVPGLPYLLFFGSIPLAAGLYLWLSRRRWARSDSWSLAPVLWVLVGCLAGYLYVYHIWTGGHRMTKLRPFVHTVTQSYWRESLPELAPEERAELARAFQDAWRAGTTDTNWVFPDPNHPYYRIPTPGTESIPPDTPWNFVLVLLETHRAHNTGHLAPYGAPHAATPFLDSLALAYRYWNRAVASGLPTINALMAIHASIPQHPIRHIASQFTTMRHEAFTTVLAQHGYLTRFFSAADPSWDNQTPWLRQWYQGTTYDRRREHDADMFAHMAEWMRDSLPQDRPFFVTAMTKTNHYPFNPVPGVQPLPDTASMVERMNATMLYTDSALRDFWHTMRTLPQFERTIFIITADHGFPLGEHGSSSIGFGLYAENIWVPMVITGGHPALGPRGLQDSRDEVFSQLDIGPTVLDLAGIRAPNAFIGHSMLHPVRPERKVFMLRQEQAVVEQGDYRWHGPWGERPREQGEEIFDIARDRLETRNLLPERPDLAGLGDTLTAFIRAFAPLHMDVIERNALLPPPLQGENHEDSPHSPSLPPSQTLDDGNR